MPAPTIYFPDNIYYRIGFKPGRMWNTSVSPSPHGRSQRRARWLAPKRTMTATLYPTVFTGPIVNVPPNTTDQEIIWGAVILPFLDQVKGQFQSFYVFGPKKWFISSLTIPGPINLPGDLPITLPFRGGYTSPGAPSLPDVQVIILTPTAGPNVSLLPPSDFTITTGVGRETMLTATSAPSGVYASMTLNVAGAQERIPAVMTSDRDDISFDWASAAQFTELNMDLEEDFG